MKVYSVAEKVAAYLAASTEFCEHGYTVVSGVRVKNVLLNGVPLQGDEIVDLLVCDGNRVLIGIAYHPETARLFNLNMRGMPYVRIPEFDTTLPLSQDDDSWLDYPSEVCLEGLLRSVMQSVSCVRYRQGQQCLASYRKRAMLPQADNAVKPGGKVYTLPAMPPEQVIDRKSHNVLNLYKQMAAKQLLRSDFTPTPYGNAHGLFQRYLVNPFGDVSPELLTVSDAVEDIRDVLSWQPRQTAKARKISLVERREQIHSPAAGDPEILHVVKNLLNTPVDIMFPNRTDELQRLLRTMESSRSLLYGENPAGNSGHSMPVYRELLDTIYALRQEFSDDPMLDDDRNHRMRRSCETLLLFISGVLLTPRHMARVAPATKDFVKKQSLKKRLAGVRSQFEFEYFSVPLVSYCRAISYLSGCEYPNWVYRSRIQPILNDSKKLEMDFSLRFLAAYCKVCQEENGDHDWKETFPLLFDLITAPVCIKHL